MKGSAALNRYFVAFSLCCLLGWMWESIYSKRHEYRLSKCGSYYSSVGSSYRYGSLFSFFTHDLIAVGYLINIKWWIILIFGFVISIILEYPTLWAAEKLFKAKWWNYDTLSLAIKESTGVPVYAALGAAILLIMEVFIPVVNRSIHYLSESLLSSIQLVFALMISVDVTLTISSLINFKLHHKNIPFFNLLKWGNKITKEFYEQQFMELIKDYYECDIVKQMDQYMQHGTTTTLGHCENVAWISYLLNENLYLKADAKQLIEAAMLHDFYLYDWHDNDPTRKTHGFDHPDIACNNAVKHFGVSKKVQEAIRSHMWPLNITRIPKSREALIICLADKYCAIAETIRLNKLFRLRH